MRVLSVLLVAWWGCGPSAPQQPAEGVPLRSTSGTRRSLTDDYRQFKDLATRVLAQWYYMPVSVDWSSFDSTVAVLRTSVGQRKPRQGGRTLGEAFWDRVGKSQQELRQFADRISRKNSLGNSFPGFYLSMLAAARLIHLAQNEGLSHSDRELLLDQAQALLEIKSLSDLELGNSNRARLNLYRRASVECVKYDVALLVAAFSETRIRRHAYIWLPGQINWGQSSVTEHPRNSAAAEKYFASLDVFWRPPERSLADRNEQAWALLTQATDISNGVPMSSN